MTPYKNGKKVIVDPSIPKLMFGDIKKSIYKQIGMVVDSSYFKPHRCMVYKVQFPSGDEFWFKEIELL